MTLVVTIAARKSERSANETWMPGTSSAKARFALLPGHDELCWKAAISLAAF
jgi:hypothetical protein